MLTLSSGATPIYFCVGPTDMRKGFDGLMRLATEQASRDVLTGGLFVFVNRRGDRVKLLWWDEDGLCIFYKRLEIGTFEAPRADEDAQHVVLSPTQLGLLLGGIELASVRHRKRYRQSA